MGFLRRIVSVLRPGRLDRDVDEELDFHRQMRLRKAHEQGFSPAEAERETNRHMGNLALAKEEMRDARIVGWLASSLQDLRHGLVLLHRDAGISALIVPAAMSKTIDIATCEATSPFPIIERDRPTVTLPEFSLRDGRICR